MLKLSPSVYYTGVLNPNMRVFDVVMRTEYGTSYNAFTVLGKDKVALIEASHLNFSNTYLESVAEVLNGRQPDYLILNHCEPDHSGAVKALLSVYPNLTILASRAGALYMKGILKMPDAPLRAVADGEEVDLGGLTLRFIHAPFLHWPDSMFTHLVEEDALFTCDFLGTHYCEPEIWDHRVHYRDAYLGAVKYYYDCIFRPFTPHVQKGLEKVKALDVKTVYTSHGPLLSEKGELKHVISLYDAWCHEEKPAKTRIPVFFCSAYGNTELLAKRIQAGIQSVLPEADVSLYNVIEHDMASLQALLNESDAFLLGSPTINRDALPPIWQLLCGAEALNIQKRPAALFGSYGWSGEAVPSLQNRLKDLKINVFEETCRVVFVPSDEELEAAQAFGERFAQTLK